MVRQALTWVSLCAGLLAGCGPASAPCAFDSDCGAAGNEACARGQCLPLCQSDLDCAPEAEGEAATTCQPYVRSVGGSADVNVCASEGQLRGDDTGVACEDARGCQEELGEASAVCGLSGTCILPQPRAEVRIEASGEADVELLTAYLEDAEGRVVGWGVEVTAEGAQSKRLDGQPSALSADGLCVEDASIAPALTLSSGQHVRVYFEGAAGDRLAPRDGDAIVVLLRGGGCLEEATGGEYLATLCVSSTGETIDEGRDCELELGVRDASMRFGVTEVSTRP